MFTGLIQDRGMLCALTGELPRRLEVETASPATNFTLGESIALNGVCLTVIDRWPGRFAVEATGETLACTTVSSWEVGQRVNMERALAIGDRLGGHLVLGHVDGVGRLLERRAEGGGIWLRIQSPPEVTPFLLKKGSVAVDGVSLTVNAVPDVGDSFEVLLIPETLQRTGLGDLKVGQTVNLEADILGKYVARLLRKVESL